MIDPEHALYEAFFATDKGFTQKTEKYVSLILFCLRTHLKLIFIFFQNLVSGTTAVCALYRQQEKKLYVAWVGDSIATLWKNGTPLSLVNKHVPERYVCYYFLKIIIIVFFFFLYFLIPFLKFWIV